MLSIFALYSWGQWEKGKKGSFPKLVLLLFSHCDLSEFLCKRTEQPVCLDSSQSDFCYVYALCLYVIVVIVKFSQDTTKQIVTFNREIMQQLNRPLFICICFSFAPNKPPLLYFHIFYCLVNKIYKHLVL